MGTDSVLFQLGLLLYVAVKFTMKVWPAWLVLGVKEKVLDAGSKTILEASPVAESTIGPPLPLGSFAETVK